MKVKSLLAEKGPLGPALASAVFYDRTYNILDALPITTDKTLPTELTEGVVLSLTHKTV